MKIVERICITSEEAHLIQDFSQLINAIQDMSNDDDVVEICGELIFQIDKLDDLFDLE